MSRKLNVAVKAAIAFAIAAAPVLAVVTKAAPPEGSRGNYIVVLKDGANARDVGGRHGLAVGQVWHDALSGFAAEVPEARLAALKADPEVAFVSEDRPVEAYDRAEASARGAGSPPPQPAQSSPTGIGRTGVAANANKGAGVTVAVVDTGIDLSHPDLAANIVANKSCVTGRKNGNDDNGHGSHVAGTIAALDNAIGVVGMAPQAKLAAVKVLNSQGSGSWSSVICGIDWAVANRAAYGIKVINMSLGGGGSSDNDCGNTNGDALHRAICRARDAGITVVVAAGNENANTAVSTPAAYDDAVITVSALADSDGSAGGLGAATSYGPDDTFATFSNYGDEVDLGAPGVSIRSTWKGGGYNTISGTSMATPHVAGAAALYLAANPGATWTQVRDALAASGELPGAGHTDPSGLHPEPVLNASGL